MNSPMNSMTRCSLCNTDIPTENLQLHSCEDSTAEETAEELPWPPFTRMQSEKEALESLGTSDLTGVTEEALEILNQLTVLRLMFAGVCSTLSDTSPKNILVKIDPTAHQLIGQTYASFAKLLQNLEDFHILVCTAEIALTNFQDFQKNSTI